MDKIQSAKELRKYAMGLIEELNRISTERQCAYDKLWILERQATSTRLELNEIAQRLIEINDKD